MICRMCGAEIPDWFVICGICGTPVKPLFGGRKKKKPEAASGGQEETDIRGAIPRILPRALLSGKGSRISPGETAEEAADFTDPEETRRARALLSRLSVRFGIVSVLFLGWPPAAAAAAIAAIVLGILGLVRGEYRTRQAAAGIAAGSAALLTAAVLIISLRILGPYAEDLRRILTDRIHYFR